MKFYSLLVITLVAAVIVLMAILLIRKDRALKASITLTKSVEERLDSVNSVAEDYEQILLHYRDVYKDLDQSIKHLRVVSEEVQKRNTFQLDRLKKVESSIDSLLTSYDSLKAKFKYDSAILQLKFQL